MSNSGLSGMDIVFCPVRRDDLDALVQIDEETSGENRADYLARKLDAALDMTWNIPVSNVVEVKGEVVDFIMVQVASGEFGLPESVATIDTIGISPAYNGKGLAGEVERIDKVVKKMTGGRADVTFEAIGNPTTIQQAFSCIRKGGRTVVIGYTDKKVELPVSKIMFLNRRSLVCWAAVRWIIRESSRWRVSARSRLPISSPHASGSMRSTRDLI